MDSIWTDADISALKAAILSCVLSVRYGGPPERTVVYQSLAAMKAVLAEIVAEQGNAAGTRRTYRLAGARKGTE